jgi:hypothetical protein
MAFPDLRGLRHNLHGEYAFFLPKFKEKPEINQHLKRNRPD